MAPRIVVVPPTFAETEELARKLAPQGFELVVARNERASLHEALATAEYLVCFPNVETNDTLFKAAPKLKLFQLLSAGYDDVDIEAARRAKVPVCNNGGANAISVAEHAMMLMLTVSRRVVWQHESVSGGRWRGNGPAPRMYEVYDKTLGIVGLGTIGKKVARLARAFGMRVQYYDIARLTEDAEDALGVRFRLLGELLATSDIVSLHVPLNASTRHLIGAAELALMKPEAIIVNTSRGPVIDEKALAQALVGEQAVRRRARRVRPGAAAGQQSAVLARQCRADRALRRPDLGQSDRAPAQRLRQRAARRTRRDRRCGWCRSWPNWTADLGEAGGPALPRFTSRPRRLEPWRRRRRPGLNPLSRTRVRQVKKLSARCSTARCVRSAWRRAPRDRPHRRPEPQFGDLPRQRVILGVAQHAGRQAPALRSYQRIDRAEPGAQPLAPVRDRPPRRGIRQRIALHRPVPEQARNRLRSSGKWA